MTTLTLYCYPFNAAGHIIWLWNGNIYEFFHLKSLRQTGKLSLVFFNFQLLKDLLVLHACMARSPIIMGLTGYSSSSERLDIPQSSFPVKRQSTVTMGCFHPRDEQALFSSNSPPFSITKRLQQSLCAVCCVSREFSDQLGVCYVSLNCLLGICLEGQKNGQLATFDDITDVKTNCYQYRTWMEPGSNLGSVWPTETALQTKLYECREELKINLRQPNSARCRPD